MSPGSGVQRGCGWCDSPGHPTWGIQMTLKKSSEILAGKIKVIEILV